MNTQQNIVGGLGLGLVAANFWTKQKATFATGALNSSATKAQSEKAHTAIYQIGLELLFVGVATLIAGASSSAGSAMVAVLVALAIVWLIKFESSKGN